MVARVQDGLLINEFWAYFWHQTERKENSISNTEISEEVALLIPAYTELSFLPEQSW